MSNTTVTRFSSLLRNCVPLCAISPAKQTHTQILVHGLIQNVTLQTDLLLVYSRCGLLQNARDLFDKMLNRNMHSWNIMIASCAQSSLFSDALSVFDLFLKTVFQPDHYTLPPVIKACAGVGDFSSGVMLHSWVVRLGFEEFIVVGSSVLDFYLKFEHLSDAERVFINMSWRDSVVWNSMISGYGRAGFYTVALNYFREMLEEGVEVDAMMIPSILNACGGEGNLMKGKEIHGRVIKTLVFDGDIAIGNSLIDMYAKCGCLYVSEKVFRKMGRKNLVTWTTMISCFGVHGRGKKSLMLFDEMRECGFLPNTVTLTAILASCSHSGLIEHGRRIFNSIFSLYGVEPSLEHYACMVDLLGRSGYPEEALRLIKSMKLVPGSSVWGALLSGCLIHKDVEIGEIAANYLFDLEPRNPSNYIALCSIYDSLGMRNEVSRIRTKLREMGLVKSPGYSWLNISGKVHKFYHGDLSHPLTQMIYKTLDGIIGIITLAKDRR